MFRNNSILEESENLGAFFVIVANLLSNDGELMTKRYVMCLWFIEGICTLVLTPQK